MQRRIVEFLRERLPGLIAVYAFGSRANGTFNNESDLDLAVLAQVRIDQKRLWDLSNDIAEITGFRVDLLDMREASTVMQYQILTGGKRWWAEIFQADLFECTSLNEKIKLDELRAPILEAIQKTGRVYG